MGYINSTLILQRQLHLLQQQQHLQAHNAEAVQQLDQQQQMQQLRLHEKLRQQQIQQGQHVSHVAILTEILKAEPYQHNRVSHPSGGDPNLYAAAYTQPPSYVPPQQFESQDYAVNHSYDARYYERQTSAGHRVAKILRVNHANDEFPIEVDTQEMLPMTIMLKRKRDRNGGAIVAFESFGCDEINKSNACNGETEKAELGSKKIMNMYLAALDMYSKVQLHSTVVANESCDSHEPTCIGRHEDEAIRSKQKYGFHLQKREWHERNQSTLTLNRHKKIDVAPNVTQTSISRYFVGSQLQNRPKHIVGPFVSHVEETSRI
ncbi:hypothetical protein PsorP6_014685 [Peronosclerospora sorghi]|uniref:Uncharacterized protein n=1 Tax=Peronosclerospora sorghi TaxID=230839 RepID=A0ACC0VT69_9STRA|nr:hypothetical protein PsorP6_014685 [Peronosclerospora sorghi]